MILQDFLNHFHWILEIHRNKKVMTILNTGIQPINFIYLFIYTIYILTPTIIWFNIPK